MRLSIRNSSYLLAFITMLLPCVALAGVPDAGQSTVESCLVTCPAGDKTFQVVVRDAVGAPCAGSVVELSFCGCPGQQLCQAGGACSDGTVDRMILAADASGTAVFNVAAGGECPGGLVDVSADGVLLAQRELKTYDVTGNFIVEANDFPNFGNVSNDTNCDGAIDLSDLADFNLHLDHFCEGPVDNAVRTWGSVKVRWP